MTRTAISGRVTARTIATWIICWATFAGSTALLLAFRSRLDKAHVVLLFLLVVLSGSAAGGRVLGVLLSLAAFFLFDWAFLPPYGTMAVRDPLDWLALVAFLLTSLVTAQLLYTARAERAAVERAEVLREAGRLKDALLAAVSHDLRTPLTSIKGLAREISELGDERALIIEEEADRLNRLVSDLLDVARLDGGSLRLDLQVNAVEDLLGATLQQFAGRAERDRIHARLDAPDEMPLGKFDFVHALRIVTNLVENALKYSPSESPVELSGGLEGTTVVIRVSDVGAGLSPESVDHAFQPFARLDDGAPSVGSAGLGLSIARGLAQAQGGSVEHKPRTGGGSTFTLRLPAV
jgi:two-component system sensor histidine kinase KdpD